MDGYCSNYRFVGARDLNNCGMYSRMKTISHVILFRFDMKKVGNRKKVFKIISSAHVSQCSFERTQILGIKVFSKRKKGFCTCNSLPSQHGTRGGSSSFNLWAELSPVATLSPLATGFIRNKDVSEDIFSFTYKMLFRYVAKATYFYYYYTVYLLIAQSHSCRQN